MKCREVHLHFEWKKMGFGTASKALLLLLATPIQSGAQYFNPEYVSPAPRGGGNRDLLLAGYSANYPSVQVTAALEVLFYQIHFLAEKLSIFLG